MKFKKQYPKFITLTKLKICWAILFKCKYERVGQFIDNRYKIRNNAELFYTSDKMLADRLYLDIGYEWEKS